MLHGGIGITRYNAEYPASGYVARNDGGQITGLIFLRKDGRHISSLAKGTVDHAKGSIGKPGRHHRDRVVKLRAGRHHQTVALAAILCQDCLKIAFRHILDKFQINSQGLPAFQDAFIVYLIPALILNHSRKDCNHFLCSVFGGRRISNRLTASAGCQY